MSETPAPHVTLRRIGAVLIGFIAILVLSLGTDMVLHATGVFPPWGQPMSDALFLLATAYRTLYSVAGCYLAARLAPDHPMQHAMALGTIGLLVSITGAVGTWNLGLGPHWYAGLPASKLLSYYYQHFDTVELNNTFYKLPKLETMRAWRDATPNNFRFAVKASRFLTHNKKLKEPQNALDKFLPRAEALGKKLGPILFQLPPLWRVNPQRLEDFLKALPRYHRYTFEFREPSWICDEVCLILQAHNAAFCIYDIAGYQSPLHITADWTYVRLHGPGSKYQGSYSDEVLRKWARQIREWSKQLEAVYVYFDNDQAGYAARNALTLKGLVLSSSKIRAA
jgi:uncharacterized protein YecE (DUF72 family)